MTASLQIGVRELPERVVARLALAMSNAEAALIRAGSVPSTDPGALIRAAQRAGSAQQRVAWLQRAATAWAAPLSEVAACRRGCAHCCHIAIAMTDVEAKLLGSKIGRTPANPSSAPTTTETLERADPLPGAPDPIGHYDNPCPFLVENECSVYQHRPLACRTHLNLDVDPLLCELIPGGDIPVPYANASKLKAFYAMAQPSARWADIRAFFPAESGP